MNSSLLVLPIALPLAAAALTLLVSRWRWAQRAINLVTSTATRVLAVAPARTGPRRGWHRRRGPA